LACGPDAPLNVSTSAWDAQPADGNATSFPSRGAFPESPITGPTILWMCLLRRPLHHRAEPPLAASNELIGVAISDYYPKFRFPRALVFDLTSTGALFLNGKAFHPSDGSAAMSAFPILRSHRSLRNRRGAYAEALAPYRQAALRATEDVENALMDACGIRRSA